MSERQNNKIKRKQKGIAYLATYLMLLPIAARADVVDTLNNFLGYLTGGVGKAVATIAIVGVGFGCFMLGKIPKGTVISVVIGVGVIFSAKALLGMLTG
ncbi:MAG: TrbC/VirB2 family protein [Coxiellaceae bacterium]|nr:TrbC/VirB2 family protein [Coxiellaceae bacterium]